MSTDILGSYLGQAQRRLMGRLAEIESRLDSGERGAWETYLATLTAFLGVLDHSAPGRHGELLTTAEMAARLNVSPKTVLKWKAQGRIRPARQQGKLIRWKGDEGVR
jgi:excisionase family DNA binding protein